MNVSDVAAEDPEYLVHPLLKEQAVEGRTYQALLLSNIVKYNSLVVAPTGTGKTVLFLLATIHALQDSEGFTIILAPTLALIDQHVAFFREKTTLVPKEILAVTGKTNPTRRQLLWSGYARIFVSTPETLANDLHTGHVDLRQCRLLVIDEAHRGAQEKYQRIMEFVRVARAAGSPLQLLAVSATIPEPKLLEIMAALDLEHIEIKTAREPDMAPYLAEAQIEQVLVPLPEPWHQVMDELLALRAAALRGVTRYKSLIGVELRETASRSALVTAFNRLKKLPAEEGDRVVRTKLSSRLAAAIKLDHALDLFSRQGKTAFLEYVQKLYNEPTQANKRLVSSPQLQKAIEIATALDQEHPKVRELLRILETEAAESVMVFSKSKPTVFQLAKLLQGQGIRTNVLVGKRDLSEQKRQKILQAFQTGQIRVLVSTSVGEEGLDVGCDLVIFYDATASVIRRVQRKGRLRKSGKIIFLVAKDTADEVFHWISKGEETKMRKAFERLKAHPAGTPPTKLTPKTTSKSESQFPERGTSKRTPVSSKSTPQQINLSEEPTKDRVLVKVDPQDASLSQDWLSGRAPEIVKLGGPSFVIGKVAVFRFDFSELLQDLAGGTLLPKLLHAAKQYEKCVVILEGGFFHEALARAKIHAKAVLKTIWSIVLDLGIAIIPSDSTQGTKHLLERLVNHQQTMQETPDLKHAQENLITSLPGVSDLLAKRLLARYQTPQKIFSLGEEELQAIHGIGKEKSRNIWALLNSLYPDCTQKTK